jgi:transcriptional regulator with XRE-family HTH domain
VNAHHDTRLNSNLIGQLLAETRRTAGLSQRELARRIGRTQNWVSGIEAGHLSCRYDEFVEVATALGADPEILCARYLELCTLRAGIARQVRVVPDE